MREVNIIILYFIRLQVKNDLLFFLFAKKNFFCLQKKSIYSYNKSYIKCLISYDAVLNKLLKSYCNMLQAKIILWFISSANFNSSLKYQPLHLPASLAQPQATGPTGKFIPDLSLIGNNPK